jgi:hypothetical protein
MVQRVVAKEMSMVDQDALVDGPPLLDERHDVGQPRFSFWGPERVLQYLARYMHRVAISNHRPQRCAHRVPLEGLRPSQQATQDELNSMRSFYAASCSMFCRRVSRAFVISDS